MGFEPTVHLHAHTLSKRAPSATRTLLQKFLKRAKDYLNYSLSYKEKSEIAYSLSFKRAFTKTFISSLTGELFLFQNRLKNYDPQLYLYQVQKMLLRLFISFFCIIPIVSYSELPLVLVSIPPYLYFVKKIAGDTISAESLIPPGENPHLYEPTPKQVQLQKQAVLWLKLGEKADQKAQRVFQEMKNPPLIIDLTENLELLSYKTKGDCCSHVDTKDLHIWLSPKMMQIQAKKITQSLIQLFPNHIELYQSNLNKLLKELEQVDQELATMLKIKQGKAILTSHPAFAYFCRDYQLEQLSLEEEGKDCLPQCISELLHRIKTLEIDGIIIESRHGSKAARLLAQNLGIPTYFIDPYSENYIVNLKQIAEVVKNIIHD